jgi:hypothetical protein
MGGAAELVRPRCVDILRLPRGEGIPLPSAPNLTS